MKKKSTSQSAFFNLRILIAAVFCLGALAVALFGAGVFAQPKGAQQSSRSTTRQDAPGTQTPDVVQLVGPAVVNNLRDLPYIAPAPQIIKQRLTFHPRTDPSGPAESGTSGFVQFQSLLGKIFHPVPTMPAPLLTFDGMNSAETGCLCLPPDTDGDVGPNHYVEGLNSAFRVYDKSGNPLSPVTTFDSFFSGTGTPCDNNNQGDPFVFYDHLADRWVITDFAFPSFPGNSFWECIGVSQTGDPTGTYNLYALQVDPANPTFLGDYPKFAMWDSGGSPAQNAYFLSVNLFSPSFQGVRVYALDRAAMLAGQPNPTVIAFTIPVAAMSQTFSGPIAAGFRTGDPPPAGRDEFLLAIDSPDSGGVTLTQVHAWFFHVDFVTPANSTFGVGPNHLSNAEITVDGFVDAFDASFNTLLVPQQGTAQKLDTLGDRIMTPVVYQNRNGTESLWADSTVCTDQNCTGPTGVRWYQFDVTGGNFPATPVQQQTWTNANDGLWRWMPSIAVDQNGNTAIGYSGSKGDPNGIFPSIRYAGRLESDPPGNLGQGEAIMTNGGGAQTHPAGRWGDYTYTSIDPSNGTDFWHVNEYYVSTSSASWATKIGKFNFVSGGRQTPTPRPRPTPHPRP
jgi:hypothetical protein